MHSSKLRPSGFHATLTKPHILVLEIKSPTGSDDESTVDWVLIERSEQPACDQGGTVHRASIRINYWDLSGEMPYSDVPSGEFDGFYDAAQGGVSITSTGLGHDGYVVIDPPRLRGMRLGTYLMNEIVCWAKQWPDAEIKAISLRIGDAGAANKERRNRFYQQFGIDFDYASADQAVGVSRPMRVQDLTAVTTWQANIIEHDLPRFLCRLKDEKEIADHEARLQSRGISELNKVLIAAERRPVLWAIRTLVTYHSGRVSLTAVAGIVAAIVFLR